MGLYLWEVDININTSIWNYAKYVHAKFLEGIEAIAVYAKRPPAEAAVLCSAR